MAQMIRDLRHARVVSQLDQTYHPSTSEILEECTIFSPLLSGTFRALINSNVSPENRTEFFAQLVDGIAFLHKHGIAHRDIKPDNIAVKSYIPPAAMIIDFGCASTEESILYYDNPGTIPYLAPEQVKGKFHGRPVDSWACALVGTELLGRHTERRVHGGPLLQEYHVWLEQRHDNPLAACCKNILQEDPAARMAAADAFLFLQQRKPKPGARRLP